MSDTTINVETSADGADSLEQASESIEDAATSIEAAAETLEDSANLQTDLDVEHRLTVIEQAIPNLVTRGELDGLHERVSAIAEAAYQAQDAAATAAIVAEEAAVEAEDATDPSEVESMIEGTEVVETEDGAVVLDAPSDVPPPGSDIHFAFADRKTLAQRFSAWLSR